MQVPGTLAALLAPPSLSVLEAALAPPRDRRAPVVFELEIEAAGEGTWVLRYEQGGLVGKKGFAKAPLLSVRLGKGALQLVRDELQAAVDGFPQAPELARRLAAARGLEASTAAAAHAAIAKLAEGHCIHFSVVGDGQLSVARGPVDEATRELTVSLDGKALRALLTGAPLSSVTAGLKGDRSVGTAVLAALGPVLRTLNL
jgi:hypothetical protein